MTRKRVTLHPLREDGTIDLDIGLYPKTFVDGIIDRKGQQVDVATKEDIREINNALEDKVDKVAGKGLSTYDFDDEYLNQVDSNTAKLNNVRYDSVTGSYYVQGNVNFWGDYPRTSISIDGDNDGVGGDDALVIQRDRLIGSWQGVNTTLMLPISHDNDDVIRTLATQEWIKSNMLVSVTWQQLWNLKDEEKLIPGMLYRITDYTATTSQPETSSAGHYFDIIVMAINSYELSEDAMVTQNDEEGYFDDMPLYAWKIKYCLANDTNRFAWADEVNGKGVIYWMRDEFGNEAPYDFKNMLFARYKVTACANCPNLVGRYVGVVDFEGNPTLTDYMTIDTTDKKYFYTFDCCQTDYSRNKIGAHVVRPDGTSFELTQIQCVNCSILSDEHDSSKFYLNNVICLLEDSRDCMFRITGWCENSTLLGGSSKFTLGDIVNSIVGTCGGNYIDGYTGHSSSITELNRSLLLCSGSGSKYALYSSTVNAIYSTCIVSENRIFDISTVGTIVYSTLIGGDLGCFAYSNIHYIAYSDLRAGRSIIGQSDIIAIVNCNIKVKEFVARMTNIGVIQQCTGDAPTTLDSYFFNVVAGQIYGLSMKDTAITGKFISSSNINICATISLKRMTSCDVTFLNACDLQEITGCSFKDNVGITCAQDLEACNFESGVNYITLSSTTTSQTISHTNIFDVSGEENNIKSVVIPEDYSTIHTVNVYSTQPSSVIVA